MPHLWPDGFAEGGLKAVILCIFLAGVATLHTCIVLSLNLTAFQGKFHFIEPTISPSSVKLLIGQSAQTLF